MVSSPNSQAFSQLALDYPHWGSSSRTTPVSGFWVGKTTTPAPSFCSPSYLGEVGLAAAAHHGVGGRGVGWGLIPSRISAFHLSHQLPVLR